MGSFTPPPTTALAAGDRLDRYELLCVLAQGGMGTVWLARLTGKLGFERLVAVKTILPEYTQDRQWVAVPRGNRYATLLTTTRRDWGGDLLLEAKDLPAKVSMAADPVPSFMGAWPVVFEAAADAPLAGTLAEVHAKPADPKATPFKSSFALRSDLIYGYPNLNSYWGYTAPKAPVACPATRHSVTSCSVRSSLSIVIRRTRRSKDLASM